MAAPAEELFAKSDQYYQNVREDMLAYIPEGVARTLEFGCGQGNFSALLKERFNAETWAVEINEKFASQAAKKLHKVITGDAHKALEHLPDGHFDCIICFDFLEHLADPFSLLMALKSKLTDNGVVVSSIPNIRYYSVFRDFVLRGNWDYKEQGIMDRTHLRFFTYKSIIKTFTMLDYKIIRIKGIHPTRSRSCKILQMLTFGLFADVKYKHFVSIAKPI